MSKIKIFSLTKKDFAFETFRGTGAGGQNRNKVETCVRIKHVPSNSIAQCCEERSQWQNKQKAFKKLCELKSFKNWIRVEAARRAGELPSEEELNHQVDEWMKEENLKIEYGS